MSLSRSVFSNRGINILNQFPGLDSWSQFSPLDFWDPFGNGGLPSSSSLPSRDNSALVNTRMDWKETPEAHVFKADLPGLKKEEVKVEIEDEGVLRISGQRKVEKEDKNEKWHRLERSSGSFMRRLRLPENAKLDRVKVAMENGVLTVTVPKEEVKNPEVKPVKISYNNDKCVEQSGGNFIWTFRLPKNAALDLVQAENGVLTVTVPKEEGKNPKVKSVQISG